MLSLISRAMNSCQAAFKAVLFVASLSFMSPSYADTSMDGNALAYQCQEAEKFLANGKMSDRFYIGNCFGIVTGILQAMYVLQSDDPKAVFKACFPKEGLQTKQAVGVVMNYLRNNRDLLNENAYVLVIAAFVKSYPCS